MPESSPLPTTHVTVTVTEPPCQLPTVDGRHVSSAVGVVVHRLDKVEATTVSCASRRPSSGSPAKDAARAADCEVFVTCTPAA